ncbi:MAG: histidine phosphatase family protein [Oscillospiraceae bacterium]
MTTVYFVLHAESDHSNHDDKTRPLTSNGIKDRLLVSDYLQDKNISVALSSPYKRAIDTVKHFADKNNLQIQIVDGFRERGIDSVWIDDFAQFSKNQWQDFGFKLTDGENLKEVQNRNIESLTRVLEQHEEKSIIIGTHGTALSTIINYYDNSFGFEDFNEIVNVMPWIVRFSFENRICIEIEKIDLFRESMSL